MQEADTVTAVPDREYCTWSQCSKLGSFEIAAQPDRAIAATAISAILIMCFLFVPIRGFYDEGLGGSCREGPQGSWVSSP